MSDLYCLQGQAHYLYWKVALQQVHLVHINHTATDWEVQHEGSHIVRPKAHTNEQRLHFSSTAFKISARSILAQHLLLSKCGLLNNLKETKETKMTAKLKCYAYTSNCACVCSCTYPRIGCSTKEWGLSSPWITAFLKDPSRRATLICFLFVS